MFVELFLGEEHREPSAPRESTLSGSVFLGRVVWRPTGPGPLRSGPILLKAFTCKARQETCVREASALARANGWPEDQHVLFCGPDETAARARCRAALKEAGTTRPIGAALRRACLAEAFCPSPEGGVLDRPHAFAPRMMAYSTHARLVNVNSYAEALDVAGKACVPTGDDARGRPMYPRLPYAKSECVVVMQGLDTTLSRLIDPHGAASSRDFLSEADFVRPFLAPSLLAAVSRCHEAGIAHLDIKPDNIGVHVSPARGTVRAVLIDFGLSFVFPPAEAPPAPVPEDPSDPGVLDGVPLRVPGALDAAAGARQLKHHKCGTMQYVPPEMFLASSRTSGMQPTTDIDTRRADVFSAAASIAEALTGRRLPWADTHLLAVAFAPRVAELLPSAPGAGTLAAANLARRRASVLLGLARDNAGAWYNPAADGPEGAGRTPQPRPVVRGNEAYVRFCRDPAAKHSLRPGAAWPSGRGDAAAGAAASLPHLFESDGEMQRTSEAAANHAAPLGCEAFERLARDVSDRLAILVPPASPDGLPASARPILMPTFAEYIERPRKPGPDPTSGARLDFFAFGLCFAGLDGRFLRERALPHELIDHPYVAEASAVPHCGGVSEDDPLPGLETADARVLAVLRDRARRMLGDAATASAEARVGSIVGKIAVAMSASRSRARTASQSSAGSMDPDSLIAGPAPHGGTVVTPPGGWGDEGALHVGSRVAASFLRASRMMEGCSVADVTGGMAAAQAARPRRAATAPPSVASPGGGDGGDAFEGGGWGMVEAEASARVRGTAAFDDDAAIASVPGAGTGKTIPPLGPFPGSASDSDAARRVSGGMVGPGMPAPASVSVSSSSTSSSSSSGSSSSAAAWKSLAGALFWMVGQPGTPPVAKEGVAPRGTHRSSSVDPEHSMVLALRTEAVRSGREGTTEALEAEAARQWAGAVERTAMAADRRETASAAVTVRAFGMPKPTGTSRRLAAAARSALTPAAAALAQTAALLPLLRAASDGAGSVLRTAPGASLAASLGSLELLRAPGGLLDALTRLAGAAPIDASSSPLVSFGPLAVTIAGDSRARVVLAVVEPSHQAPGPPVRVAFRGAGLAELPDGEADDDEDQAPLGAAVTEETGGKSDAKPGAAVLGLSQEQLEAEPGSSADAAGPASGPGWSPTRRSSDGPMLLSAGAVGAPRGLDVGGDVSMRADLAKPAEAAASASAATAPTAAPRATGRVDGVPAWASARLLVLEIAATTVPTDAVGSAEYDGASVLVVRRVDQRPLARWALELQGLQAAADTAAGDADPAGGALGFWGTPLHKAAATEEERARGFATVPTASQAGFSTVARLLQACLSPLACVSRA